MHSITPTHSPVSPGETDPIAPFVDFRELERQDCKLNEDAAE